VTPVLQLCRQFEMLVQSQAPSVFMHMMRLGVQPLKIAFPWLMFGFSGTLDVCEVVQHATHHMSHVSRHIRCCSCGIALLHTTRCFPFQCLPLPCLCSGSRQSLHAVTRHTSHVTRHTSHVTRHTSHVTRHTSHVTRHTSRVTRHTPHVTRHVSRVTRHTSHVTSHTSHVNPDPKPSWTPATRK
jgi:hypothetical protein